MKKLVLIALMAVAIMPLLPESKAANDATDNTHSVNVPISVLMSKDK